jgi:hypothetical protein
MPHESDVRPERERVPVPKLCGCVHGCGGLRDVSQTPSTMSNAETKTRKSRKGDPIATPIAAPMKAAVAKYAGLLSY